MPARVTQQRRVKDECRKVVNFCEKGRKIRDKIIVKLKEKMEIDERGEIIACDEFPHLFYISRLGSQ